MISVVVCTYNRAHLLPICLQSLVDQAIDKSLYEVIVVDNNSTDETSGIASDFAKRYENFTVVYEKKQGKSYALNAGIDASKGKYVAFIDDDAKAFPDWLERIMNAFNTVKPEPAAVGGKISPWYEQMPPAWFTDDLEIRTWGDEKGFLKPPRAQHGFSGSNMTLPREILNECGGFMPDVGPVGDKFAMGEEITLYNRIYEKHPWFWYDPTILVEHFVPVSKMSVGYRIKRAYLGGISMVFLQKKISIPIMIKTLLVVIVKVVILPFKVRWWQKNWQRSFIYHVQPIANAYGFLAGNLFK